MILYFRFLFRMLLALRKPKIPAGSKTSLKMRVWLRDCASKNCNNSRFYSFMDIAQHENNMRTGFIQLAMKKGWSAVYRSARITFYKPMPRLSKFEVTAQVVTFDDKFFYWRNEFINSKGELAAVGYSRVSIRVRKERKAVDPREVISGLDPNWTPAVPASDITPLLDDVH